MLSQEERMENMKRIRILSSGNSMLYFCTWLYLEGVGRFMPKSKHFPCWISSYLPNSLKRYRGSRSTGLCLTGELEVGMQNSIRNKLYGTSGHVIPTESIMVFIREVPQILSRAGRQDPQDPLDFSLASTRLTRVQGTMLKWQIYASYKVFTS